MLEDVGLIVDGLVGNLQEGAIPAHLQHIIERFESIIQLDLTRRGSSSPWAWPAGGLGLLRVAGGVSDWLPVTADPSASSGFSSSADADAAVAAADAAATAAAAVEAQDGDGSRSDVAGLAGDHQGIDLEQQGAAAGQATTNTSSGSSSSSAVLMQAGVGAGWGQGVCEEEGQLRSLELALLKPSDVARLMELPAEVSVRSDTRGLWLWWVGWAGQQMCSCMHTLKLSQSDVARLMELPAELSARGLWWVGC
jgi:hypothetical protein